MTVHTSIPAPRLDAREAEALAQALHCDPFRVLGPHDTPSGRLVRALLPGATGVDVLRRRDRAVLGRLEPSEPHGLFSGIFTDAPPYLLPFNLPAPVPKPHDPSSFVPPL